MSFNQNFFNQLQRGSFRGVDFLIRSGEIVAGRKTVIFEFPNNNYRFVEDLGGLLEVFTITAVITGTRYKQKRDALRKALETAGIGVLVHPFGGRFNVTADPYTLTETIGELNVATFEMVFRVATDKKFPLQAADNRSAINKFSQDVLDSATAATESLYEITDKWRQNYQDALDTLNNFTQALDTITEPFDSAQTAIAEFAAIMKNFKDSITNDIKRPTNLANSIKTVFEATNTIGSSAQTRTTYSMGLFGFGNTFYYPPPTTAARVERNINRRVLTQQINISALSIAYLNAIQIQFQDEDHLNSVEQELQTQYDYVIALEDLTTENLLSLKQLRNQAQILFNVTRVNIKKTVVINTFQTSITALTYQYYNNLDNDQLIMSMNNLTVPNNISGSLQMVTQ